MIIGLLIFLIMYIIVAAVATIYFFTKIKFKWFDALGAGILYPGYILFVFFNECILKKYIFKRKKYLVKIDDNKGKLPELAVVIKADMTPEEISAYLESGNVSYIYSKKLELEDGIKLDLNWSVRDFDTLAEVKLNRKGKSKKPVVK